MTRKSDLEMRGRLAHFDAVIAQEKAARFDRSGFEDLPNIDSLCAYLETGRPVGGFLQAVIAGDLFTAATRADGFNQPLLYKYAQFLVWRAPRSAVGSDKAYQEWVEQGGLAGLDNRPRQINLSAPDTPAAWLKARGASSFELETDAGPVDVFHCRDRTAARRVGEAAGYSVRSVNFTG